MKFSHTALIAAAAVSVQAADSQDANFLTALVSDYKGNAGDYLNFFGTAKDIPPQLMSLAQQVKTYKDDSYTTLLNNNDINIGVLESYATNLPWYSRVASAAGITGTLGADGSASATGSGADSASITSAPSSGSAAASSGSKSASGSSSAAKSSSSNVAPAGAVVYGPLGIALGAAAVALL